LVTRQQDRDTVTTSRDGLEDRRSRTDAKGACRIVEQENPRQRDEGRGDVDQALLPNRQTALDFAEQRLEPQLDCDLGDDSADVLHA
jgi:hypothetical protein